MARKIKFEWSVTAENPITREEVQSAELVLARLIAADYAADHPELFEGCLRDPHIMGKPSMEAFGPQQLWASERGNPDGRRR
jgi:hypothetical protein